MGMEAELLVPGVQHGGDAQEPAPIGGEGLQGPCGGGEQGLVGDLGIACDERKERMIEGEDDVEVAHRQKIAPPGVQPSRSLHRATGGAVRIVARVPQEMLVPAVVALLNPATECGRATLLDVQHRLPLGGRQVVVRAVLRPVLAEDLRHGRTGPHLP